MKTVKYPSHQFKVYLKSSLCSLIFMLHICGVFAQYKKWDSTYRPTIYESRVALFRSFPDAKKDIVFLGNSITSWGQWCELLESVCIKNRGIPGDITFGVLDRLDEVIEGKPAKVFILIGINDIARNVPDTFIIANYQKMIHRIKTGSPTTEIYFQTIFPVNYSINKHKQYNRNKCVKKVNESLKKLAAANQVEIIDLYKAFADENGQLPARYTFDGIHLKVAGYRKWVEILKSGGYLE